MQERKRQIRLPPRRIRDESLERRLTENARRYILPARYLQKDASGRTTETPDEMFRRVAENVAEVETRHGGDSNTMADAFYDMMARLEFMPNSPTLMNAGGELQQLAACFVMSPDDSLDSIFETLKRAAVIFQSGGGVGYAFSKLRPTGDRVKSTGGIASGPVSFMHVYDQMCATLKQGGKRRGAQMGILRVDHPDIGRFVVAKRQEGVLANFNISVAVTDDFVKAIDQNADYTLYNPRTGAPFEVTKQTAQFYHTRYEKSPAEYVDENFWRDYAPDIDGIERFRGATDLDIGAVMRLPARFVWTVLIDSAWQNGEPGLFMIDATNRDQSFNVEAHPEHRIEATNPCGEQPLENFEACVLGHVNLSLMVADDAPDWREYPSSGQALDDSISAFLEKAIDWNRLRHVVRHGTRFLDNAITASRFPLSEIEETVRRLRNVGLGIMGFAQLLVQLGVVYGSDASYEIARQLMAFIGRESKQVSHQLAEERGTFGGWIDSKYARPMDDPEWFRRHTGLDPAEWTDGFPLRNHHTTSIAPTGTTSMIANTSGGCEPFFNVVYFKNVGKDVQGREMLTEFDEYFLQVLEANGVDVEAVKKEARQLMQEGTFEGPRSLSVPNGITELFVTAAEISPDEHVRMQAAFQEYVDSGISKTINFSADATRDDVDRAYRRAIELGCKGLTVYRAGSRREEVLKTGA